MRMQPWGLLVTQTLALGPPDPSVTEVFVCLGPFIYIPFLMFLSYSIGQTFIFNPRLCEQLCQDSAAWVVEERQKNKIKRRVWITRWAELMTDPLCPKPAWLSLRLSFHLGRRRTITITKKKIPDGGTRLALESDCRLRWLESRQWESAVTCRLSVCLSTCLSHSSIHQIRTCFNPDNPPTPLSLHAAFVELCCSNFSFLISYLNILCYIQ